MFGRSKPILFEPHGRRRARKPVPRWLVLLLLGVVIGAGGVIYVQERHLPPRLSAQESVALRGSFEKAEAERLRLSGELDKTAKQLADALSENTKLTDALGASRATIERLGEDVASLVAALPPDPRAGVIAVRAARFEAKGGSLVYDLVLSRERANGTPLAAILQLVVAGETASGGTTSVELKPVKISVGSHETLHGSLPLPEGFRPRQATVLLLNQSGGTQLGMRIFVVK